MTQRLLWPLTELGQTLDRPRLLLFLLLARQRLDPELAGGEAARKVPQQKECLGQHMVFRHRLERRNVERGKDVAQRQHAVDRTLDQSLVVDLLDIFGADPLEHAEEGLQLLLRVGERDVVHGPLPRQDGRTLLLQSRPITTLRQGGR